MEDNPISLELDTFFDTHGHLFTVADLPLFRAAQRSARWTTSTSSGITH